MSRTPGERSCWTSGQPRLTLVSAPAGLRQDDRLSAGWIASQGQRSRRVAVPASRASNDRPRSGPTSSPPCSGPTRRWGRARCRCWSRRSRPVEAVLATLRQRAERRCPDELDLVLDDYHLVDNPDIATGMRVPARAPAAAGAPRHQHARRPRRCRWPGCGPAVSWSRSGPPTCASPPTEAAAYLNEVTAARAGARRRRRARAPHRGLDRGPAAGGPVAAGPARPARLHRRVRRRRPLRRRLPGRRGARPTTDARPRRSCSRPPSSTG